MIASKSSGIARSAVALGAFLAAAAFAQAPALATYRGADRLQRITEAAKREGVVTIYTSTPVDDIKVLTDAFERKYGVRTNVWRASSETVLQRGVAEARAGRIDVDIFETNGPELEALAREGMLTPVWSATLDRLMPEARTSHGLWVGTRLNVFALAYNTKLVKQARSAVELRRARRSEVEGQARDRGGRRRLVRDPQRSARRREGAEALPGHRREERHFGAQGTHAAREAGRLGRGAAGAHRLQLQGRAAQAQGRADRLVRHRPAIAQVNGVGVAARPPHPHAAVLLYDFEISEEGQSCCFAQHSCRPTATWTRRSTILRCGSSTRMRCWTKG